MHPKQASAEHSWVQATAHWSLSFPQNWMKHMQQQQSTILEQQSVAAFNIFSEVSYNLGSACSGGRFSTVASMLPKPRPKPRRKCTSGIVFDLEGNLPLLVSTRIILVYSEGTPISKLSFIAYKKLTLSIWISFAFRTFTFISKLLKSGKVPPMSILSGNFPLYLPDINSGHPDNKSGIRDG
ncbi:carboxysome shell carbonic anhydrase [Striga asiatica]|uniref:Carboxysome shell carbonic anhydrase n=1 Tax=Striga asiatica TaxID=4170 RepID=A0A5A7RAH4_STRAF|nr:carboxysome shell carbonic anhydrase [Striga asiatica]